jgi:cell volume regulation protein A
MDLPVESAILIGAALACTSSSITVPILQQIEIQKPAQITLLLEASMSDAFAVLTVGILLDVGRSAGSVVPDFALKLLFDVTVSLAVAILGAVVWSFVLPKLSEQRFWQVLTFAVVLVLYAGVEHIGANGLIAVLGFGLGLANFRRVDPHLVELSVGLELLGEERHSQMISFHSELAFLVRSFFFVLIGVTVKFVRMLHVLPAILGIVGAIIAARWLAFLGSRWLFRNFRPLEQEIVFWIMPRGLITVVLALQIVRARGLELAFLPSLAFGAILATNFLVVIGSMRARQLGPQPQPMSQVPVENSTGEV